MSTNLKFPNSIDPASFYEDVLQIVKDLNLSYLDAIICYCERNNIEIETAATLVKGNFRLKASLQSDGEQLNILEKTAKLPL